MLMSRGVLSGLARNGRHCVLVYPRLNSSTSGGVKEPQAPSTVATNSQTKIAQNENELNQTPVASKLNNI